MCKIKTFEVNKDFFKYQSELINSAINDINKQKKEFVLSRCIELGLDIDFEAEERMRFKSFIVEVSKTEETYWYNDGSELGLRVATFKRDPQKKQKDRLKGTVSYGISCY